MWAREGPPQWALVNLPTGQATVGRLGLETS
jgi:hypothetical protein